MSLSNHFEKAADLEHFLELQKTLQKIHKFFVSNYEARRHNLKWFQNTFDLDPEFAEKTYKHYQSNRKALVKAGHPYFTSYLFECLQAAALELINSDSENEELKNTLAFLSDLQRVHFDIARFNAHENALHRGFGTSTTQTARRKSAGESIYRQLEALKTHQGKTPLYSQLSLDFDTVAKAIMTDQKIETPKDLYDPVKIFKPL